METKLENLNRNGDAFRRFLKGRSSVVGGSLQRTVASESPRTFNQRISDAFCKRFGSSYAKLELTMVRRALTSV